MAFFDSVRDSLRVTTETAGLKSQLRNNLKMIEKLTYQIGLIYVRQHETGCEPEYAQLMGEIRRLEEENANIEQQLNRLAMTRICPQCGAMNMADAAFCGSCGAPLAGVEAVPRRQEVRDCPRCGALNAVDAQFCAECGEKLL